MVPVLTFTSLYPNREMPQHGLFVEERLRHLVATGRVSSTVVAPVPWFPSGRAMFGQYARFARVPKQEERNGIEILHPRYPMMPKLGTLVQPFSLACAARPSLERLSRRRGFSVIDAHYFYPDGVAAAWLARRLRRPLVITARGSDINVIARLPAQRRMILWAARASAAVVTVSDALRSRLVEYGVPADKIHTLRNGVDLDSFAPGDRSAARAQVGATRFMLLSVGRLVEGKGHQLVIEALRYLPDVELVIVGEGPWQARLAASAQECDVADRVRLTGSLERSALVTYYRAADVFVLASAAEGMPNVVLEAMACGTPAIAADVGGLREILGDGRGGRLLATRSPQAIASAVEALRANPIERAKVRAHAETFSWDRTVRSLAELFERVAA